MCCYEMQIWAGEAMRAAQRAREEAERMRREAELARQRQIAQEADANLKSAVKNAAASQNLAAAVRDVGTRDKVDLGTSVDQQVLGIYEKTFADMQGLLGADPSKANADHVTPTPYFSELMKATMDLSKLREQPDGAAAQIKRYEQFFEVIQKLPVGAHHHHPVPGPAGAAVAIGVECATQASVPRPMVHSHDGGAPHKHDDHDHPHPHPEVEIEIVGAQGASQSHKH